MFQCIVNHQVAQVVRTGDISDETLTTHSLTHGYNPQMTCYSSLAAVCHFHQTSRVCLNIQRRCDVVAQIMNRSASTSIRHSSQGGHGTRTTIYHIITLWTTNCVFGRSILHTLPRIYLQTNKIQYIPSNPVCRNNIIGTIQYIKCLLCTYEYGRCE